MAQTAKQKKPLSEVMLAMDVVDTLRHRANLVKRELSKDSNDKQLLNRLRKIYSSQGIDVPDHILKDGIEALRKDRFTYKKQGTGLARKIAEVYANRSQWGKPLLKITFAVAVLFAAYKLLYEMPQQRKLDNIKQELSIDIPKQVTQLEGKIVSLNNSGEVTNDIEMYKANISNALQSQDIKAARIAKQDLQNYMQHLRSSYKLQIVSRAGELSGVWRIPDANPNSRNFYVIVEPIDVNGKVIDVFVTNEESNKRTKTNKFGVRVTEPVFDSIKQDKSDDGIIQNNIIGAKPAGTKSIEYNIPVSGGIITSW